MPSPSPITTSSIGVGQSAIDLLVWLLITAPILSFFGMVYLWYIYFQDKTRPRSWLLLRLAQGATIAWVGCAIIATLAHRRLSGTPLGQDGTILLALTILAMEVIPPLFAVTLFLRRRKGE